MVTKSIASLGMTMGAAHARGCRLSIPYENERSSRKVNEKLLISGSTQVSFAGRFGVQDNEIDTGRSAGFSAQPFGSTAAKHPPFPQMPGARQRPELERTSAAKAPDPGL